MNTPALKVTVLGCSGSYASAGGACTGFLVQSPQANVWLDAGPGTLANLQDHICLSELTAIVLSHEHADHWLELPVVYNAIRHYVRCEPIPVYGTTGTFALARNMCEDIEESFTCNVIKDKSSTVIGDQKWRWSRTDHYVETLAPRVEVGDSSMVFSADTGPEWDITQLGPDIGLLIAESTFLSHREKENILHLSARQAGRMAEHANVSHLVLSHLAPGEEPSQHLREASEAFAGEISLACVGKEFLA
ncbi:MAG: MBL fold metallo-hydrolase [Actinomycetota bacterium]|nr:MBL fold metallo-hydrolase [Actinomycetota bacterium]